MFPVQRDLVVPQPRPRLVFKYHCEPASKEDADALCDQIRLASEYRHELALIENRGRALRRNMSRSLTAEMKREMSIVQTDPDLKIIRNQLLEMISISRNPGTEHSEREACMIEVMEGLAEIGLPSYTARYIIESRILSCAENDARLALRHAYAAGKNLAWGTYQATEDAHDFSCRTTPALDDVRIPPFGAVGCAAVHLQPARPLREDDPWIRIGGIVRRGSEIDKSGRVRPARHRDVQFRIGTQSDRSPRFARLFVLMHREIPSGWEVAWAKIHRRQIASRHRWELHVTATAPVGAAARPDPAGDRPRAVACGVDIGWRLVDGGVRIARWCGTDGRSGETIISDRILGADRKSDDLRAIRDRVKNEEKEALLTFRASIIAKRERRQSPTSVYSVDLAAIFEGADPFSSDTDWFVETSASMHLWLRTSRFVRLARLWSSARFLGDAAAFDRLQAWLRQDRHLWDWEAFGRAKRQRRVDAIIRDLAVRLGREYERIGVEAPFVGRIVKKPTRCEACRELARRCDECAGNERLRRLASTRVPHAAPARTRQEIKIFGTSNGAEVVECDPAYTTRTCSGCGYVRDDVLDWSPLTIRCSLCDLSEDQDVTAALNLARLASGAVRSGDGKLLAPGSRAKSKTYNKELGSRRTRKAPKGDSLETA